MFNDSAPTHHACGALREPVLAQQLGALITFAAPRVGCARFRDLQSAHLAGQAFRFEHANDIVPRLPQGFGYEPCGALRYITSFKPRGRWLRCPRPSSS